MQSEMWRRGKVRLNAGIPIESESGAHIAIATTEYVDVIIADHTAASSLRLALDNALDYWVPCDKDEARDWCMVHHAKHCAGDAAYLAAREMVK